MQKNLARTNVPFDPLLIKPQRSWFDITLTGFETPEIDLILDIDNDEVDEEIPIPTEAPEICQKGDLWQLGEHKLYIGDSLFEESYRKLLGNEVVDMVFTDPPYNVEYTMYEVS